MFTIPTTECRNSYGELPDTAKLNRHLGAPEHGPKALFFSGGSALNGLSRQITDYTHNSIHLITPFDSGGSSAALRDAFDMPGIGDLRHRVLALADQSAPHYEPLCRLLQYRFSATQTYEALTLELGEITSGSHALISAIPSEVRVKLTEQLSVFSLHLPENFDLRRASIGNLVLAGGYLANANDLGASLLCLSELLNIRGTVHAIVKEPLHLGVQLDNGQSFIGQHLLTGKEHPDIPSPVSSIFLNRSACEHNPIAVPLDSENSQLISGADIICYAPGSFYSSLMANLLPVGVGEAVAKASCPKVFVPNLGLDPEQLGMGFSALIQALTQQLRQGNDNEPVSNFLNYVVIDADRSRYPFPINTDLLKALGVELLELPLVTSTSDPYYDDDRLAQVLLSLI